MHKASTAGTAQLFGPLPVHVWPHCGRQPRVRVPEVLESSAIAKTKVMVDGGVTRPGSAASRCRWQCPAGTCNRQSRGLPLQVRSDSGQRESAVQLDVIINLKSARPEPRNGRTIVLPGLWTASQKRTASGCLFQESPLSKAICGGQLRWQAGHLGPAHRWTGVGKPAHRSQNCFRCRHSGTQLEQPLCAKRLQPVTVGQGMKRERKSSGTKLHAISAADIRRGHVIKDSSIDKTASPTRADIRTNHLHDLRGHGRGFPATNLAPSLEEGRGRGR